MDIGRTVAAMAQRGYCAATMMAAMCQQTGQRGRSGPAIPLGMRGSPQQPARRPRNALWLSLEGGGGEPLDATEACITLISAFRHDRGGVLKWAITKTRTGSLSP